MKKSCMAALLALLLALCCAAGAFAEISAEIPWMDEARTIALIEAYYGPYAQWPNGQKDLVEFYLAWVGALEQTDDVRKLASEEYINMLSDEEYEALVDRVICEGLGLEPEEIDALSLTQAVWGERETWSEERAAFWADLQAELERINGYEPEKREERLRLMLDLDDLDTELEHDIRALSMEMWAQDYNRFASWPLEIKAMFKRDFAPRIRQAIAADTEYVYPGNAVLAVYDYGLPGEGDLSEEAAKEAALDTAVAEFGLSRDELRVYGTFFDVTDAERPLWRFYVRVGEFGLDDYRVQLDARTGEVVEASKLPLPYQVTRWENWLNGL